MSPTLLGRCVRAWLGAHCRVVGGSGVGTFDGETADELLEAAGISFVRDPVAYCRAERMVREAAWREIGGKVTRGGWAREHAA